MESWKEEYLAHHGVLGMKWGVRRYQNADGSLKPAGEKRYNKKVQKIQSKYDKALSYSQKRDQKMLDTFYKGRSKMEAKYDKKISKLQADRKSYDPIKNGLKDKKGRDILTKEDVSSMTSALDSQIKKLQKEKSARLKVSSVNERHVKAGQNFYNKVLKDYKDVQIKALEDKSFKKSKEYKRAVASYVNQMSGFMVYGSSGIKLAYAYDIANKNNPKYRNRAIPTFKD